MRVRAIQTKKITSRDRDLYTILDRYLSTLEERSVLAVTSKIVAICQGRMVEIERADKQALIAREADYYLPPGTSRYGASLTIKGNLLTPMAGIDESNGDGYYVLWPRAPQETANEIRAYLRDRFSCREVGVLLTDSRTTPLRWGVTGVALAHSGFLALNDYIGRGDLFGRPLRMTKVHVADGLAAAAVLVMGEGDEQTPLAVIDDLPFVAFQERDPTPEELEQLHIRMEDDLYGPLLAAVEWQKGRGST